MYEMTVENVRYFTYLYSYILLSQENPCCNIHCWRDVGCVDLVARANRTLHSPTRMQAEGQAHLEGHPETRDDLWMLRIRCKVCCTAHFADDLGTV